MSLLIMQLRRIEIGIKRILCSTPQIALAFSGGVDSAYLLYAAKQLGAEVRAYYVKQHSSRSLSWTTPSV